jgi:hypothetical protein
MITFGSQTPKLGGPGEAREAARVAHPSAELVIMLTGSRKRTDAPVSVLCSYWTLTEGRRQGFFFLQRQTTSASVRAPSKSLTQLQKVATRHGHLEAVAEAIPDRCRRCILFH